MHCTRVGQEPYCSTAPWTLCFLPHPPEKIVQFWPHVLFPLALAPSSFPDVNLKNISLIHFYFGMWIVLGLIRNPIVLSHPTSGIRDIARGVCPFICVFLIIIGNRSQLNWTSLRSQFYYYRMASTLLPTSTHPPISRYTAGVFVRLSVSLLTAANYS